MSKLVFTSFPKTSTDAPIIWLRQLNVHILCKPAATPPENAAAHSIHRAKTAAHQTDRQTQREQKTQAWLAWRWRHGRSLREGSRRAEIQLFLPAEETWHSVPSKAGYRTLLSLQLLQTNLTSYHQCSKEKSGKKSHRFHRCCSWFE